MSDLATLTLRAEYQEAALLALLDRVTALEKAMRFEVGQREAMEQIIVQQTRRIRDLCR